MIDDSVSTKEKYMALQLYMEHGKLSIPFLQNKLRISYFEAKRIMKWIESVKS